MHCPSYFELKFTKFVTFSDFVNKKIGLIAIVFSLCYPFLSENNENFIRIDKIDFETDFQL